jgi:hypothetical protein
MLPREDQANHTFTNNMKDVIMGTHSYHMITFSFFLSFFFVGNTTSLSLLSLYTNLLRKMVPRGVKYHASKSLSSYAVLSKPLPAQLLSRLTTHRAVNTGLSHQLIATRQLEPVERMACLPRHPRPYQDVLIHAARGTGCLGQDPRFCPLKSQPSRWK